MVFLHGNPSWSYIWRKIIPPVVAAGHRAIAVDLVGMGRSDKPSEMSDYSVARHVAWMRSAIFDTLDLRDFSFVLHDWGVIIGLRVLSQEPDRVSAVCVSNSRLPLELPEEGAAFAPFQQMVREDPNWEHWNMVAGMVLGDMPQADIDGYRAPCPSPEYLVCNRQFTQLLPTTEDNPMYPDNQEAWKVLENYERPFLTLYSDKDLVAPTGYRQFRDAIPGAMGQPHTILEGGSHFPLPVLAECTEPLPEGADDIRGLWRAVEGARTGHVERVEQCGSRVVVTSSGIVHDYGPNSTAGLNTDDTEGSVLFTIGEREYCMRTSASMIWEEGVLNFYAFGWGPQVVNRYKDGDQLVWEYADGSVNRMERICTLPEDHKVPEPRGKRYAEF